MTEKHDFKKDWEVAKKQLIKFSQEAANLAKKGEKEFIKLSQKSKVGVEVTKANIRKEQLYYLIGKEYSLTRGSRARSVKMKKLLEEFDKVTVKKVKVVKKVKASHAKKKVNKSK